MSRPQAVRASDAGNFPHPLGGLFATARTSHATAGYRLITLIRANYRDTGQKRRAARAREAAVTARNVRCTTCAVERRRWAWSPLHASPARPPELFSPAARGVRARGYCHIYAGTETAIWFQHCRLQPLRDIRGGEII